MILFPLCFNLVDNFDLEYRAFWWVIYQHEKIHNEPSLYRLEYSEYIIKFKLLNKQNSLACENFRSELFCEKIICSQQRNTSIQCIYFIFLIWNTKWITCNEKLNSFDEFLLNSTSKRPH